MFGNDPRVDALRNGIGSLLALRLQGEPLAAGASLYEHSAAYFDLVHQDVKYEAEAERLERIISCRVPHASSLLDVGCGTGRHLEYFRSHYEVAGVDISEQLLAQARKRLPGVPLHLGDLRSFDLRRRFDVVTCLFSTIGYAETRQGLHAAGTARLDSARQQMARGEIWARR